MNFWIGNHQGASGKYATVPFLGSSKGGDFQHTLVVERDRFLAEARRRTGDTSLTLAQSDGFWWQETGRSIAAAPGAWLKVQGQKCRLLVNDYEPRTNASLDFLAEVSPVLRWDPLRFGLMAILATLGATELRRSRHRRARWLLATLLIVPGLTCIVFFVSGEYRHPAAPAMVVLAAFGLARLERISSSRVVSARTALGQAIAASTTARGFVTWPRFVLLLATVGLAYAPTERLGPARDRKAYAEALAMPNSDGSPPTMQRYDLARRLLSQHGSSEEDRLLSAEALLLVESNQAIQFRDRDAAQRLILATKSLWNEDLWQNAALDVTTIERIRRNSVRRVTQLCRQPFVQKWQAIQLDLILLGCHSWTELGHLLSRQMIPQAAALLERANELAPNSVEVLAYRGQLELIRGHDPTPWLQRSLDGYPRLALPATLMAQYAFAQGDVSSARNYTLEASRRESLNRVAQGSAEASRHTSREVEAAEWSRIVTNRGLALLRDGHHEQAISVLESAVRDGPYDEALHYTLGQLMLQYCPPDAMIEFFASEVERDEKPQTSHYFLAMGFGSTGNVAAAQAEFNQALVIDPAHEMSQRQWGLLLERQGRLVAALEHLVEATRIHPEYRVALEDAARVADRLGRHSEAEHWRSRARTANPDTPRRFLYWSKYLHEHGRDSAALVEVGRRLEQDPRDAEALELNRVIRAALGT
jgi:tetratricopeptide (TPR) repeat protein